MKLLKRKLSKTKTKLALLSLPLFIGFIGCHVGNNEALIRTDNEKDSLLMNVKAITKSSIYDAAFVRSKLGLEIRIKKNDKLMPVSLMLLDSIDQIRIKPHPNGQVLNYQFDNTGLSGFEINYLNDKGEDVFYQGKISISNRATNINSGKVYTLFYDEDSLSQGETSNIYVITNLKNDSVSFVLICETPLGYADTLIKSTPLYSNHNQIAYSIDKHKGRLRLTGILERKYVTEEGVEITEFDRISYYVSVIAD